MVILCEENIEPSVLGVTVFDPETWDLSEASPLGPSRAGAALGEGRIEIFMYDLLGVGTVTLRINFEEDVHTFPDALEGRVLLGSGALWIDEIGSGSFRSGATVKPGRYSVSVQVPESENDAQTYTLTLFDFMPVS